MEEKAEAKAEEIEEAQSKLEAKAKAEAKAEAKAGEKADGGTAEGRCRRRGKEIKSRLPRWLESRSQASREAIFPTYRGPKP